MLMKPPRKSNISPAPARRAALEALLEVERRPEIGGAEALDQAIARGGLDPRDARLASALVYGVLRRAWWLDFQYGPLLDRPVLELDPGVRALLRMAAFQRFLLSRVPPHAIANDSVELARRYLPQGQRLSGFVNAVVRRIVALKAPAEPESDDPIQKLSQAWSCPPWIIKLLRAKFGDEPAVEILKGAATEAPVTLRANLLMYSSAQELARILESEGTSTLPGRISPDALVLADHGRLGDLLASPLFEAGAFYLQDEASQVVAHLAAPAPGERVLDLCAAPGGKATHMAELARGKAVVTATDLSVARLHLVRENAARLQTPGLETVALDELRAELEITPDPARYDLVLVDAPCSGLGTLRRNPEIRYRSSPDVVKRLAATQADILADAALLVRPGGRIVYSTCTITDTENGAVVQAFLDKHPQFQLGGSTTPVEQIRSLRGSDGLYRTWPACLEVDGFEAAVLVRG